MSVVSYEVASSEIQSWLDAKKVPQSKREASEDYINTLIDAVAEGEMVVNSSNELEYKLKFPTEGEEPVTKITFKPRIKTGDINTRLKNMKSKDSLNTLLAVISAVTNQPTSLLEKLDTQDMGICNAVAVFFI